KRTPKDKTAQMAHKAHAYGYLFTVLKRMTRLCRSFQMYGHAELATDDDNDLANKLYDELELPESQPWKIRASPGFEFVRLGVPDLLAVLRWKGFEVHAKRFPVLYTQILRILHNAFQNGRRGYLLPCDVVLSGETSNLVTSALMGGLSMPMFDNFQRDVWEVFQVAKRLHNDGSIEPQIKRAVRPEEVPLMETVKPLLYALGLKDVGRRALHQFVGNEPTAMGQARVGEIKAKVEEVKEESDDAYESEEKNGIVNHPRALAICSVLGRAHLPRDQRTFGDRGGRFSHDLAVIAATFANRGVCPTTGVRCLDKSALKETLSLMYNCGMNQFTGKWNFSVGIPASSGSSGMTFVVVPGVMGMAIYSPKVNKYNVSSQAHQFVELMTKRYRLSVFDRLVYRDLPLEALPEPRTTHTTQQTVLFFELCMNASKGNVEKVEKLLREGVDVNRADYDNRTALHIACSDGHAAVVSLLISEGADILAKDRWGQTPFDDAVRQGHGYITDLLLSALELQGYRIAPLRRAILTETRNDEPHGSLQSPSLRSASQMADSPQDGEFQGNGSTQDVASEPAPRREREVSFGTTSPRPLSSTARQHRRVGFHGPIVETQEEDKSSEGSAGETRSDPW
ncbi:GLS2, partial [Symbiodinium sp. KB8]